MVKNPPKDDGCILRQRQVLEVVAGAGNLTGGGKARNSEWDESGKKFSIYIGKKMEKAF